jgi:hypothetical protein
MRRFVRLGLFAAVLLAAGCQGSSSSSAARPAGDQPKAGDKAAGGMGPAQRPAVPPP